MIVLVGSLPSGTCAYVDKDWIPRSSGPVAAIIATTDGLAWCGHTPRRVPSAFDLDSASAAALLAVARDAAAVEGLTTGPVELTARNGLVARQVRALIGHAATAGDAEPPQAIIDVTGDPRVIADATQRVADLGTLVLAGESLGRTVELNLYPDVHRRGLKLVGIAAPLQHDTFAAGIEPGDPALSSCLELLTHVHICAPLPPESAWYRVS